MERENEMKILETDKLLIREFVREDIPLAMQYSQERGKRNNLPDEVFETMDQATSQIGEYINNYSKKIYPMVYAIVLKESNRLIGDICIDDFEVDEEIGYSIAEKYQGNGYAAEAMKSFVEWRKETGQKVKKLYGIAKKSNISSWKSLEKAGFTFLHEKELRYFGEVFVFKIYMY